MATIEEKLVEMTERLQQLAVEHAPAAWETTLMVVRLNAMGTIFMGMVFTVITGILIKVSLHCQLRFTRIVKEKGEEYSADKEVVPGSVAIAAAGGAIGSGLFSAAHLLDWWDWVAMFEPQLYIARTILKGVL